MTEQGSKPISGGRGHMQGMVRQSPAGAGLREAVGKDSLSSAVEELHGQNPQKWNDLGPHHADSKK